MCGFFQVIQKNSPIDQNRFQVALDSMHHRGPDASGTQFETISVGGDTFFLAFGHQRLSILDLDARSNQPFNFNQNVLLYNGEIYNYPNIKGKYQAEGVTFNTSSDTEALIVSLSRSGFADITDFNGMWAFSFFEKSSSKIYLSRDRYGKKPLFYYQDANVLCVSSTIKAIKKYLGLTLKFEEKYLINYLVFGDMYPTEDESTHFQGIKQVLPGHNAIFDLGNWSLNQKQFFDPAVIEKDVEYTEESLVSRLKASVESRLVSDRPVGLLLSGGIDSSLILSILHHCGYQDNVHVFMGDTGRSDDYKYAKASVEQLGIKADTIVSDYSTDAFDRFLQICLHHEKCFPFNGSAIAMSQMFEEVAASGVPVVLDGTGGDEIFGGYWQRHLPFAFQDAKKEGEMEWLNSILAQNKGKEKSIENYFSEGGAFGKVLNPFFKIPIKVLLQTKTLDPVRDSTMSFTEALATDISPGGRLGDWIWHNDRNSMMHSVESRSPLLDKNLHAFIGSGYKNKFKDNWSKYELRKVFDQFTPIPTQWRVEKQGFRWDGKHFFKNNQDQIIEIIEKSEILEQYMNKKLFCQVAKRFPKILKSSMGRRMLGVAGVEYMMNNC